MKVSLTKGEAQIAIQYDLTQPPPGLEEGLRTTTLTVTLPSGEKLTSQCACHSGDQFVKRAGRFYAFQKLREADNDQATQKALDAHQGQMLKQPETAEGLAQAAKAHYKLSRDDRRTLFQIVCPEFFRNTPERRKQRELALLEHLKKKYRKKRVRKAKTITEDVAQLATLTDDQLYEELGQRVLDNAATINIDAAKQYVENLELPPVPTATAAAQ